MKTVVIVLGIFALMLSAPAQAYEEHRQLRLNAAGIETLKITCDAGDLSVSGREGATEIFVKAHIELPIKNTEKAATFAREQIALQLLGNGREAHLTSTIGEKAGFAQKAVVHLQVEVPSGVNLDIADGSGKIVLRALQGNLNVVDGSGPIDIRNVTGSVEINDGSGEIAIGNVQGQVTITDGSGGIRIEHLGGNAFLADGSGGISADTVAGNLTIRDGSGDIDVRRVQGSVSLSDGSGSIDVRDVGGDVIVSRDISGSRRISDVRGNIVQTD